MNSPDRVEAVKQQYARRMADARKSVYLPTNPVNLKSMQERERAIAAALVKELQVPLSEARVLEVGCGNGDNLLMLIRLGLDPANLVGSELLPKRVASSRHRLPAPTVILSGDACELPYPPDSFDIVYQSTVFTSLLDPDFQQELAAKMWSWTRPGGAILWYDFTYNNPRNPDVLGVPLKRVRELFPLADIVSRRLTLAPPIARRLPAWLYDCVNVLRPLRTHLLCWIRKPL
ncbi:Methyltransferase domain protein [compost metagenome]|jgi:SAM-dependent methyltransferase